MGLFDKLSKKTEKEEKAVQPPSDAPGWDGITQEFERVYPGQENPRHYGTLINWSLGGNDPLDGISIYEAEDYWHFVTYGLTELYDKESEDEEISGYGYEMTFKLKKDNYEDLEKEIRCICGILQTIARLTFTKGEIFGSYHYLYTGQETGIDANSKSSITGFIFVPDPTVNPINTANGSVKFLELIGMTYAEMEALKSHDCSVKELYERLGTDVTSYHRESLI